MTQIDTHNMVGNAHRQRHRANAQVKGAAELRIERTADLGTKLGLAVLWYAESVSASETMRRYHAMQEIARRLIAKVDAAAAEAERAKRRAAERKAGR